MSATSFTPAAEEASSLPTEFRNSQSDLGTAIETSLQDLSTRHADLVEDREQVLIDRQRITSSAFSVRKLRDLVKDAEARLMNVFRRAYNDLGENLSDQVAVAYAEVEKLRDDLVDTEDEHAELVESLEISEWALTKKEEDLYQRDIPRLIYPEDSAGTGTDLQAMVQENHPEETTTFPSPDVQHHIALENYRHALRQFRELSRVDIDETNECSPSSSNVGTSYIGQSTKSGTGWGASEVLDNMVHCEVEVIQTRKKLASKATGLLDVQMRSEPSLTAYFQLEMYSRRDFRITQSEVGRHRAKEAVPSRSRVDEWILDCLRENIDHKLHFMTVIQENLPPIDGHNLEYEQWEERIMQHWIFDASGLGAIQSTTLSMRSSNTTPSGSKSSHANSVGVEFGMMSPESLSYEPASASRFHRALKIPHFHIDSLSSMNRGHTAFKHRTHGSRRLDRVPLDPEHDPPPEVRVTAPEDEVDLMPENIPVVNQLSPLGSTLSRRDSAHSPEAEEPQHERVQQADSVEDHESLDHGNAPTVTIDNRQAVIEDSGWLNDKQRVRYTPWIWSPDLTLHYTHGLREDDEVIEAIWLQFPERREGMHTENASSMEEPKEQMDFYHIIEPRQDAVFDNHCTATYRRFRDMSPRTQPGMEFPYCDTEAGSRDRAWQSAPSLGQNKHNDHAKASYHRVYPFDYGRFFVLGRIFKIDWRGSRNNSWGQFSQSSRESSPERSACSHHVGSQTFVVVENKVSHSICIPIRSYSVSSPLMHHMHPGGIGELYTSLRPPRPRSNDMYGAYPLRADLKDTKYHALPPDTRIYYEEPYEIKHDTKLFEVGIIDIEHRQHLIQSFLKISRELGFWTRDFKGRSDSSTW